MSFPTLYSCHQPVEQYRTARTPSSSCIEPTRVPLQAVDSFLLARLAALVPTPPTVVDLAFRASGGESRVLWTSTEAVRAVVSLSAASDDPLRVRTDAALEQLPGRARATFVSVDHEAQDLEPRQCLDLRRHTGPLWIHLACHDAHDVALNLTRYFAWPGPPTLFVMPVGRTGECGILDAVLHCTRSQTGWTASLPREWCPFLATSRLAVVHPAGDPTLRECLDRISWMYQGNFDFLSMARRMVDLELECQALRSELAAGRTGWLAPLAPKPGATGGDPLVDSIASWYRRVVPAGIRRRLGLGRRLRNAA